MDLATLIEKLRALGVSEDRLDTLTASAADPRPAMHSLFDRLDAGPRTGDSVAAMSLIASAVGELSKTPARPPLSAAMARIPAGSRPRRGSATFTTIPGRVLTAGGAPIEDRTAMGDAFSRAFAAATARPGADQSTLHAQWSYPEDRQLGADPFENAAKMDAVADAITASGGVCNPVDVDYNVSTWAVADRPLRDSLPAFQATRGGVRFLTPPTLASTSGATGVWTEATDVTPGGSTKPILTVACGSEVEVFVDAIPTRLKIGNMLARFSPEQAAAILNTALAQAARTAELNLLSKISAASTAVSSAQLLGTTRDLLATIDLAVEAIEYRQRLPETATLQLLLPGWAQGMCRADLARQLASDNSAGDGGALAVTDAQIDNYFRVRGVIPTWLMDGPAANATGISYGFQGFGAQTANAALQDWPRQVVFWLYPTGSFQFLDGGRLEVGVVRDSALNSTNDHEMFVEGFEGVANRGLESLQVVASVRPNGESAAAVSTASY